MSEQIPTGYQQPAVERTAAAKRRSQALIGAGAGLAVVAVLIATFVWIRVAHDDSTAAPAAAPAASGQPSPAQPAPSDAPPSAAAGAPGPGGLTTPPALTKAPTVKGGTGDLTGKTKVKYLIKGDGPVIKKGQMIAVNYTGVVYKTGKEFDSSWNRPQPFVTQIGVGKVIPGWDQAMIGVLVGSRVQLDIPAELAYGEKAQGGAPAGDLRFVVDVLAAR